MEPSDMDQAAAAAAKRSKPEPAPFWGGVATGFEAPRVVTNRTPTPQDLLELSSWVYKASHKLYSEADSQGMRVYHDELITGDVRCVMAVPSWFPKAHVAFDWSRLEGDTVSVVLVLRGTMQDLVGNTRANLQLLYNKLLDDSHVPDVAADATKVVQAWIRELLLRHPQLDAARHDADAAAASDQRAPARRLTLDVHVTGHSLGGLLAEVATVESHSFAERHGLAWACTSFESPGLPDFYHAAALRIAPEQHWRRAVTAYLAAPNVINMLYPHLGSVVHVVVPWEQTWSHVVKCVGADAARVTAWAIVGGMVIAAGRSLGGVTAAARRQQEQDAPGGDGAAALAAQQCSTALQAVGSSGSIAAAPPAAGALPAAASAAAGPPVPQPLLFTVAEAAGGATTRRLLSSPSSGLASAAAHAAVAAATGSASAPAGNPAGAAAPGLAAAAIGAAAATGEAVASFGGGRLLQQLVSHSGLGVLANVLGGWAFGRGGLFGVMECLAGVLGVEVEELIAQHSLNPMRQCFCPHTGQLKRRYCRRMASWPHLGRRHKVILTAAKQVAKWTIPSFLCADNVGIANVMSRTAMVEARCARLAGYEVLPEPEEAAAAAGGGGAAMESDGPGGLQQQQGSGELVFHDCCEHDVAAGMEARLLMVQQQQQVPLGLLGGLPPQHPHHQHRRRQQQHVAGGDVEQALLQEEDQLGQGEGMMLILDERGGQQGWGDKGSFELVDAADAAAAAAAAQDEQQQQQQWRGPRRLGGHGLQLSYGLS